MPPPNRLSRLIVDPKNRKAKAVTVPMPPQYTSRWCRVKAVAANGATIDGLEPDSLYVDITVQCINQVGEGPASNTIPLVQTHRT